ncbi:MAG: tetratricopeptide repeat protein, partial [Pseudonocardiaceae bacterium]
MPDPQQEVSSSELPGRARTLYRRILGGGRSSTERSTSSTATNQRTPGIRHPGEDALDRHRRDLGSDHPQTLSCAHNLASTLRSSGEHERARALDEDTLDRYRRVLGADHPSTLRSANSVAVDLS